MTNNTQINPGLEGVIAAETRLSRVDGLAGELIIGGFALETIAPQATFLEMVYLLWHGRLPNQQQLQQLETDMAAHRNLPPATLAVLAAAAAAELPLMDALRIGTGTLNLDLNRDHPLSAVIVARFPTIVAAYWRLLNGLAPIPPALNLSHTANFLYMLTGSEPTAARTRALDTYFNTVIDHGLNASTFAARVIIATGSDMVSAVTGAVGALKGPLHGGAPGPALETVFEIGTPEKAEPILRAKLDAGERLMGFGHRVYKVRDPRALVLGEAAEAMYAAGGDIELYNLAKTVEITAVNLLAQYKPGRNLQTNVEYYTALLLHGLGLDTALFTPTFALSRVAGWIAHCFEQQQTGRLIRPKASYVGETDRVWQPLPLRN